MTGLAHCIPNNTMVPKPANVAANEVITPILLFSIEFPMSLIRTLLLHTPTMQSSIVNTTSPMHPFIDTLHPEQNPMELGHSELLEYPTLVTCEVLLLLAYLPARL